ncbi:MAG: Lrp/AsnC family transcriptional regulator [Xanthomonadaceae bacterium]|nr:Lrp/AsnC family transcriptional regulator [Xanthomonadaceae bacterium]MDE1964002.1 Lrp/AsnC family transcriptional regulator [Xanthomonadaceae bacterium]
MTHRVLDRTDLKILEILQRNGRLSNTGLARQVSLSPSACLARLRALEQDGFILGYRAQLALEAVREVMVIYAEVTMGKHVSTVFAHFEKVLEGIPEIVEAVRVSGPFDYLLKAVVGDMNEWKDISQGFLNEDNGVAKLMTLVVMQETKAPAPPPLHSKKPGHRAALPTRK